MPKISSNNSQVFPDSNRTYLQIRMTSVSFPGPLVSEDQFCMNVPASYLNVWKHVMAILICFSFSDLFTNRPNGLVSWAHATKTSRLVSIPGRVISKTWKLVYNSSMSSFVLSIDGWVQGTFHLCCYHWLTTRDMHYGTFQGSGIFWNFYFESQTSNPILE